MTNDVAHIDVSYVADLARIELTDDEIERYGTELDRILGYVKLLGELDVDDIEPTAHPFPVTNVLRADAERPSLSTEAVNANAPATTEDGSIRVPAILPGQEGA